MQPFDKIKKFYYSDHFLAGLLRDSLFLIAVAAIFMSLSNIAFGLWVPMVAVESESMMPHIQIGDLILIESIDRVDIITQSDGKLNGYTSFDDYGDVILYLPYGRQGSTPIIHRAMYFVEKGESMWSGGPSAQHAGYITKGDNQKTNPSYDQQGSVSYLQPVKKEWIKSVARFRPLPLLGCVTLTIRGNLKCFK